MSLLQSRCLKRSFLVEELFETWRAEHAEAVFASDIEEFVGECHELCNLLTQAWNARNAEFCRGGIGDLGVETAILDAATQRAASVIQRVTELAQSFGGESSTNARLRSELDAVMLLQQGAPRFDGPTLKSDIERSRGEFASGAFVPLEDIVHERSA